MEMKFSAEKAYSKILPAKTSKEYKGFKVYLKHCSSCHSINGLGEAELGPDLNKPMNPTEYFHEMALRINSQPKKSKKMGRYANAWFF